MIAFDRDGVLVGVLGDFAAGHPKNYQGAEMPLIKKVLARVPKNSIIISNQAGIDRGYTTLEVVQAQFDWLMEQQPNFIGAFFCPDEGRTCYFRTRRMEAWGKSQDLPTFRKPDAGMGLLAQDVMGKPITHYIGDLSGNPAYADGRDTDRQFALNLGCKYLDVNNFLA
jgi:histidinol phosphatase-like enzyme